MTYETPTRPEQGGGPTDERWRRFERRFEWFWSGFMYLLAGIGVYDLAVERPELLWGLPLAGLLALLGAYFALYHLVLLRGDDQPSTWTVAVYGAAQLLLVALLQLYSPDFGNLGLALVAHLMAVMPVRLWAPMIAAVLGVIGWGWGLHSLALGGEWDQLFFVAFQLGGWVAVFAYIFLTFRHRDELSQLVAQLHRAKAELERSNAQAEELAALRERTRLAREMHDSLGHALVAVNVTLEAAERLYRVDPVRAARELEATRALVRDAMAELRASLRDLREPLPHRRDLPAALARLAREVGDRSGIAVAVEAVVEPREVSPEAADALWGIAREALLNAERHSGAASVVLALHVVGEHAALSVADDGSGIAPAELRRPGRYGVVGMRERAEGVGGALRVAARPGGGTVVEARIPVDWAPPPDVAAVLPHAATNGGAPDAGQAGEPGGRERTESRTPPTPARAADESGADDARTDARTPSETGAAECEPNRDAARVAR